MRSLAIGWMAVLGTFFAVPLAAQNSASASVTADVQQPITVSKTADLTFGTVFRASGW